MTDARRDAADLIVVGASVGGLVAAILAADRGGRTIVLERGKDTGGGAALEPEVIAAAGTRFQRAAGIDDAPERLAAEILAAARHHAEPEVAHGLARESAVLVDWLADRCGLPVELIAAHVAPGHSAVRLHAPGTQGGSGMITALTRAASRHARISLRTGTGAEALVRDEAGSVVGVSVRSGRRVPQTLPGRVLLACGGFAAAEALVTEHCPAVAELPYYGWAGAVGEALRLAGEVGAETRRLGSCAVTPFLALPGQLAVTAPLAELGALLVNQSGQRFGDETADRLVLARAVRAQPGRIAYLVFDERIAGAGRAADPFFAHVVLPRAGRRAEKLEELAKQFEIDAEGLLGTIEGYNASRADQALVAPFHAIRVTGARRRTYGGLAVDGSARVLNADGRPIPGRYATGGAAAGLGGEGTEGALPGTDALAALGLARLAAVDVIAALSAGESEPQA